MQSDLNLNTVVLTSTLRTAPLNGSPSSSDYNSSQRENLVDLATLSSFVNNTLLPLINALPADALLPTILPVGIEGRTIWADTSDVSNLFFDSLTSTPLTIADALRVLNGMLTTMSQQLIDQGIEVASLQARLASTNQNDIALALQNLSQSLNQITVNQQVQNTILNELLLAKVVTFRSPLTIIGPGATSPVTCNFTIPYNDDFYTATVSVEVPAGSEGLIFAGGYQKISPGIGLTVSVTNNDADIVSVIVHILASHD